MDTARHNDAVNTPDEPINWTPRDQPLYGPPAAPVPAQPTDPTANGWYTQPIPTSTPPYSSPPQQYVIPAVTIVQPPTAGLSIGALGFGLAGLVPCFFGFPAIVAIILGHLALGEIEKTGKRGKGMAQTGLWLGYGVLTIAGVWLFIAAIQAARGG